LARHTIADIVDSTARHFKDHGIGEGRRTAQLLMQHLLKMEMADLVSRGKEKLSEDLQAQYAGLVRRRLNHEPLQYITRRVEFWSRELYVDPRAPIPRPETEHIIEEVLKDYPERDGRMSIADVGVGSGALAVILALEYPRSKVIGTDLANGALEVASINASRLDVSGRIELHRGDLLASLFDRLGIGVFDVIVSNPPYIADGEASSLAPEVIRAEPRGAHVAGPTGLEVYRRLLPHAAVMLKPGGKLYLECGAGQASEVGELVESQEPLKRLRTVKDLQKIERVVVAGRQD
jgi:release factor glutamine methyltransferase